MGSKVTSIYHTRIRREVNITSVRRDDYNPMGLIIEFSYILPTNYYKDSRQIAFGLYIDKKFSEEFYDRMIKFQVENLNVVQIVEIYAHPHSGYQFTFNRSTPGNKIRLRFRAKDPTKIDINQHYVYWDNKTGSYITKKIGNIDPITGLVSGTVFVDGSIIGDDIYVYITNDDGVIVKNDDGNPIKTRI